MNSDGKCEALKSRCEMDGKEMRKMYQIYLRKEEKCIEAESGSNLLEVLRTNGIDVNAPCGGNGVCGKCKVKICGEEERIVKACEMIVSSDLEIETMREEEDIRILTSGVSEDTVFEPDLKKVWIKVPECPFGKSISEWTRLTAALKEKLAIQEDFQVNLGAASSLKRILKETNGMVWAVLFRNQILQVSAEEPALYTVGIDIGTTTVAAYLLDGSTGMEICTSSRRNPQTRYGADVISRANYALEHGTEEITACIRRAVQEMLEEMAEKAKISKEEIYAVSVVGNTCMHHLFLGISVDSLVHAPYNPAVSEGLILSAKDYDLRIHPKGQLIMLPNIAGFVGADTTACIISSDLPKQKEWTLLIDIGTNGEMVLGKENRMFTCSTAAGPAFEGARISCGMRGADGAISKVKWQSDHWEYETIGNKAPRGICGSGLLDLAAELLRSGQIDELGNLENDNKVVIAEADPCEGGDAVVLLQKDIAELQLAKAAIAAGIRLLARKAGISLDEIQYVWIAGAFGNFLSPESACAIGMIPGELKGRIKGIGNAAGEGAKQVLRNKYLWTLAGEQTKKIEFLELATLTEFQDCFVDELEFPEQGE